MQPKNNYQLLIEKLDQFTRKFYVNKMLRGGLYSIGLILLLFLIASLLEYQFYFDKGTRKFLFYSFLGLSGVALAKWVFIPMLSYFRLGNTISHEQAAKIVGDHFSNVQDKLLNILQLRHKADNADQKDLILASIEQKSETIKPVPFKKAIDLSQNKKYVKYALPPLLLLLLILFTAPGMIKDGSNRLWRNNEKFDKPAPFSFVINDEKMEVVQFNDFHLGVKIKGETLPNDAYISVDDFKYRLRKVAADSFEYTFNKVQKNIDFFLFSAGVESDSYELDVLKKPNILHFETSLDFPAYTGRKDEVLNSIGDLVIPAGTNVNWTFESEYTDSLKIFFENEAQLFAANRFDNQLFSYKKRFLKDEHYKVFVSNQLLPNADSIGYTVSVIPDRFPEISVQQFIDSSDTRLYFFVGNASDDYGLNKLSFNYKIKHADQKEEPTQTIALELKKGREVNYDYLFDVNQITLLPGDELSYYFEVYDNDAIAGNKSSRTNIMLYNEPTQDEVDDKIDQNKAQIKDDLKKSIKDAKKLQEDLKKAREKMLQKKELNWEDKKEMEKLLERQKDLEKQMDAAKKAFEENQKQEEPLTPEDQKLLEKQEKVQELFEEIMSDEMKELMKQIEDLMQELEKDEAIDQMEEMEMQDEELEMEMDRLMELYKELEVEKEMQDAIDDLEELAEEQEKLSEETKEEKLPQEELQEKQEELNEKFDKLEEKLEETKEKNEALERPKDIPDNQEDMDDIQQEMDDSKEQLEQKQNDGASKSQKGASEKMKDMAAAMSASMEAGEMEQMEEDMQALRQLLENLVGLSFDQENLIDEFNIVKINTPKYEDLVRQQFRLKDDFSLIEDSLQELSKRVFQIETFVTEKVGEVKSNMKDGLENLEERKIGVASNHQHRTMKATNDLALMLSEAMNQMQQQMSGMMSGSQMCNKPGGKGKGSGPSDKISKGQQGLNDQMKKMAERMKNGKSGSSKEFAQMAAKQAAMRKALEEKRKKLQEQGKGKNGQELNDLINEMNKVETELLNKKLTNEMLKRQQDILTRLLKDEKAERQREFDQKRKAERTDQLKHKLPPNLEEYIKKRAAEIEQYKTVSPALMPYYKFLVDQYYNVLKKD